MRQPREERKLILVLFAYCFISIIQNMERLEEIKKELQGKARILSNEIFRATFVIAELQNDVEDEGQLTPKKRKRI